MFGKAKSLIVELFLIICTITVIQLSTSNVSSYERSEVEGLYDGFSKVKILNTSNLEKVIFEEQKDKLWLVEFYKHWCGDCMRFVLKLKDLAFDIYEWRDYVTIGVVDCADPTNNEICRRFRVEKVPALRMFHPNSDKNDLGVNFGEEGNVTFIAVREKLAQILKAYHINGGPVTGSVNLQPLTHCNLERLWEEFPPQVEYLLLVFEGRESLVGSQVALDISRIPVVLVRLVDPNNKHLYRLLKMKVGKSGAVVLERNPLPSVALQTSSSAWETYTKDLCPKRMDFSPIKVANYTRQGLNFGVRKYLRSRGVNITLEMPMIPITTTNVTSAQIKEAARIEQELEKALNVTDLTTVVFQMDIEAAVNYVFKGEVSLTSTISGNKLKALRRFVWVLVKYFPTGKQGKRLFEELKKKELNKKHSILGRDLKESFIKLEHIYNPFMPNLEWMGCHGTIPMFRGYPCSLWTLFHVLVASEELHDRKSRHKKPLALNAIVGYIKYFFSCKVCSKNFNQMAKTIAGNVTSQRDAVMWLWKAHNDVNRRLAGDATEDPRHHKVQFPTRAACPSCYTAGGSWNESQVFAFLSKKYTETSHLDMKDLPTPPPPHHHTTTTTTTIITTSTSPPPEQHSFVLKTQFKLSIKMNTTFIGSSPV